MQLRTHKILNITFFISILSLFAFLAHAGEKSEHQEWHADQKAQQSLQVHEDVDETPSIMVVDLRFPDGTSRTSEVQWMGTALPDTIILTLYTYSDSLTSTYVVW